MRILFEDASTSAINFFLKFKMAAIRNNLGSNCYQLFNRKRYSETEQISDPFRVNAYKITTFEIFDVRSHDPSRSLDLGNVNWSLSRKP